jgi:hypothetical protein
MNEHLGGVGFWKDGRPRNNVGSAIAGARHPVAWARCHLACLRGEARDPGISVGERMNETSICMYTITYSFHIEDVPRKTLTINKAHVEQQVKIQI